MQQPRLTPIQRYGPVLAVVAAVLALLLVAPSKSPSRTNLFADGGETEVAGSTKKTKSKSGSTVDANGEEVIDGEEVAADDGTDPDAAGASEESRSATTSGPGKSTVSTTPKLAATGITGEDCSRRALLGSQTACKPLWTGDNGGATYKGVTGSTLTVAFYLTKVDPAVNAVLAGGGLASSREEQRREIANYTAFFQKNSQTWGRKVNMVVVEGNADTGDAAAFRADAVKIDQEVKAGLVLGAGDTDMIDELARRGIPCLCGSQLPGSFLKAHSPFVYGILPDGDTTNKHLSEFICKKLGPGSKADFSGETIHPTIGKRGEVVRRYGLSYPNGLFGSGNGKDLKARLASTCGIQISSEVSYASDINTAVQQSTANVQQSIRDKITTVICICDPLAPIFATKAATQQRYFPEWLSTGYLLQDAEALARLYDPQQWSHAFGISSLPAPAKLEDSGYYKVYRSSDTSTNPNPASAPLIFPSVQIAFAGIELTGPTYNPRTFQKGMNLIDVKAHKKTDTTFGFGPDDFGGIDDFREVWWDGNGNDVNGKKGVYQSPGDHYRYPTGTWPKAPALAFRGDCLSPGACGVPRFS